MRKLLTIVAICFGLSIFSICSYGGVEPNHAQQLQKAKAKWSELIALCTVARVTITETNTDRSSGKTLSKYHGDAKQFTNFKVFHQKNELPFFSEAAWGLNSRYAFELGKKKPEDSWVVKGFDQNLIDGVDIAYIKHSFGDTFARLWCPLMMHRDWLPELVESKSFHVKSIEDFGNSRSKMSFAMRWNANDIKEKIVTTEGWVVLSRDEYWIPVEYSLKLSYPPSGEFSIRTSKIFLVRQESGHPIIGKIESHEKPGENQRMKMELDTLKEYTVDLKESVESDFTLSAFGLLEPVTETPPPNRNFLWITLGSVAAVIIAVLVRRKIRSLEAKAS